MNNFGDRNRINNGGDRHMGDRNNGDRNNGNKNNGDRLRDKDDEGEASVTNWRASQFTTGDRPGIPVFAPKNNVPKQDATQLEFQDEILTNWWASSVEFRVR